ncbi:MAG: hypothetical protein V3U64_02500 [Cocleimonas sp.]
MEFGYPGANTHLENHGVSEESFWPSFTDIMMVIVMVFLLVTVAVILNNWTLIGDLKTSIQAQKIASTLAADRQAENTSLGSKITTMEKQLVALNAEYEQKQVSLLESQQSLSDIQIALSKSQQALTDNQQKLADSDKKIIQKNKALASLQINFSGVMKQKNALSKQNKLQNNAIAENEKLQQTLRQELTASKSAITSLEGQKVINEKERSELEETGKIKTQILENLQVERSKLENIVATLQSDYEKSQEATVSKTALAQEVQEKLELLLKGQLQQQEALKAAINTEKMTQDSLKLAQTTLKDSEDEKQRIIVAMNEKLVDSEKKLSTLVLTVSDITAKNKAKESELLALKDNPKLRSLQGKYDTLDAKYQKLLRPARSSKGKFVVSVSYKKKAGKNTIRLKVGPNANYITVTKQALHKTLVSLKAKHKTDLYLKVIIPESSGLSYNEAWKFTSNLQKQYDYYHQADKK